MVFVPKITWRIMPFGLERDSQQNFLYNWNVEFHYDDENYDNSLFFILLLWVPLWGIPRWTLDSKRCHLTPITQEYKKKLR